MRRALVRASGPVARPNRISSVRRRDIADLFAPSPSRGIIVVSARAASPKLKLFDLPAGHRLARAASHFVTMNYASVMKIGP